MKVLFFHWRAFWLLSRFLCHLQEWTTKVVCTRGADHALNVTAPRISTTTSTCIGEVPLWYMTPICLPLLLANICTDHLVTAQRYQNATQGESTLMTIRETNTATHLGEMFIQCNSISSRWHVQCSYSTIASVLGDMFICSYSALASVLGQMPTLWFFPLISNVGKRIYNL